MMDNIALGLVWVALICIVAYGYMIWEFLNRPAEKTRKVYEWSDGTLRIRPPDSPEEENQLLTAHQRLDMHAAEIKKLNIYPLLSQRLDLLEAENAKLRGLMAGLGGIEGRIRDMVRKRWKQAGVVKPKTRKP